MTDTELRWLERRALTERTLENLLTLQLARYRAGLQGIGRNKLKSWWDAAHQVLAENGRPPIHPSFLGDPDPHKLHGHFELYNVAISQYLDQNRIPMTNIMEIKVGDRGRDRFDDIWPGGPLIIAYLLDADTLVMVYPALGNYYQLRDHLPHDPWPEDLQELNDYETLPEILEAMAEMLFLHLWGSELVEENAPECDNCGHPREMRHRHGYNYYYCTRCLP